MLPSATLHTTHKQFTCKIVEINPPLSIPWEYTPEQAAAGETWSCNEVWVSPPCDLENAIDILSSDIATKRTQYTLLVNPDGMFYDRMRFGGDYNVRTFSGKYFTFSVRQNGNDKILLALERI
jgi:hypothetical protein